MMNIYHLALVQEGFFGGNVAAAFIAFAAVLIIFSLFIAFVSIWVKF